MTERDASELLAWLEDQLWNGWELTWNTIDSEDETAGFRLWSTSARLFDGDTLEEAINAAMNWCDAEDD